MVHLARARPPATVVELVEHEAMHGVGVVGEEMHGVPPDEAGKVVAGYSIAGHRHEDAQDTRARREAE